MKKQFEHKLKELEDSDVIEKVQGATPLGLTPSRGSEREFRHRICVDMRCANKAVQRERFPMPNIEDIIQQMNGPLFSRLDLSQSFHQIELDEKSRFITTFVCHKGLHRYKRLMFGINSAPEIHQRIIQQILQDIPNCRNNADDIIIFAKNQEEHGEALRLVLQRLPEKNLTLNKANCEFNKSQLNFSGHTLSKEGVKPDTAKIEAVNNVRVPKNPTEVESFLELVNFCAKYIRDFATLTEPLRKLTRKEVKWQWNSEQQIAFETLKQRLTSADVMSCYNQNAETEHYCRRKPFWFRGHIKPETIRWKF